MKKRSEKGSSRQALQNIANKHARLRDCGTDGGANCISCNKWTPFDEGDGGHFIPAKISITRYDERNINHQCRRCNRFMHGNLANYYVGMVRKYGQAVVDELMAKQSQTKKWKPEEIKEMRSYYNDKIRAIQRGEFPDPPLGTGLSVSDLFDDIRETGGVLEDVLRNA